MNAEMLTSRLTRRPNPVNRASGESPRRCSAATSRSMYGISWYIWPV